MPVAKLEMRLMGGTTIRVCTSYIVLNKVGFPKGTIYSLTVSYRTKEVQSLHFGG